MPEFQQTCVALHGKACVYCQQLCEPGEKCFAVLGNEHYVGYTEVFSVTSMNGDGPHDTWITYPESGVVQRCALDPKYGCELCKRSFSSYLAHKDCVDFRHNVLSERTTCEDMWNIGVSTDPWLLRWGGELLFKPDRDRLVALMARCDDGAVEAAPVTQAEKCKSSLPRLNKKYEEIGVTKELVGRLLGLPVELFHIIMWEMADRSSLARLTLTLPIERSDIERLKRRRSLSDCWFTSNEMREYNFKFLGLQYQPFLENALPTTDRSLIRLGVDYLGIRSVELLNSHPHSREGSVEPSITNPHLKQHSRCPWYIIERLDHLNKNFKLESNGWFIRIVGHENTTVQLWNVMDPPECYHYIGKHLKSPCHTICIDMDGVTGLTVLCGLHSIYAIHGHRAQNTAITTRQRLCDTAAQHKLFWRYFPLQRGEMITRAWTLEKQWVSVTLVILTSRGRQCFFGMPNETGASVPYRLLCDAPMKQLFYDEPTRLTSISCIGAAPNLSVLNHEVENPDDSDIREDLGFYHTSASLTNVVRAEIYSDDDGASTGLLLEYTDGSSECIGQRRVGLDTTKVTEIHHPKQIHVRSYKRKIDGQKFAHERECVEVLLSTIETELDLGNWESRDMVGYVTWRFNSRNDRVTFSG